MNISFYKPPGGAPGMGPKDTAGGHPGFYRGLGADRKRPVRRGADRHPPLPAPSAGAGGLSKGAACAVRKANGFEKGTGRGII